MVANAEPPRGFGLVAHVLGVLDGPGFRQQAGKPIHRFQLGRDAICHICRLPDRTLSVAGRCFARSLHHDPIRTKSAVDRLRRGYNTGQAIKSNRETQMVSRFSIKEVNEANASVAQLTGGEMEIVQIGANTLLRRKGSDAPAMLLRYLGREELSKHLQDWEKRWPKP